jgi:glucosyl-3-phosphoglycerate synthase
VSRPTIDPALGLHLPPVRSLERLSGRISIIIPAHNERDTIGEVVGEAFRALEILDAKGDVLVSASGCTDDTAARGEAAGARVIESPLGKGAAIQAGLSATDGEIVCLIDGDMQYLGDRPLAVELIQPIRSGIADAVVSDLYWRPLYPQMWLYGFFTPLAGVLFPEFLPKVGSTPWSGQRAALRHLWPSEMPIDFTVDLALLLHWNQTALRLRPVLADDWVNPQRPKPDLMEKEFTVLIEHAVEARRISEYEVGVFQSWFDFAHTLMAQYRPEIDDPQKFEASILRESTTELRRLLFTHEGPG